MFDNVQVATEINHITATPSPIHIKHKESSDNAILIEWAPALGVLYYEITTTVYDIKEGYRKLSRIYIYCKLVIRHIICT